MSVAIDALRKLIADQSMLNEREQLAIDQCMERIGKEQAKIKEIERRKAIIEAQLNSYNMAIQVVEQAEQANNHTDGGREDPFADTDDTVEETAIEDISPFFARPTKPSAAQAVRALLSRHPEGMTIREVTDRLAWEIDTRSPTPKRVVQNTVYQLRVHGTLEQFTDESGAECVKLKA